MSSTAVTTTVPPVEAGFVTFLLPSTVQGVNYWMFFCILGYIAVAYFYCGFRHGAWTKSSGFWINKVFGGANLGVSILLAPSLLNNNMITLLGQAPLYLTIAGFTGLILGLAQLGD